MTTATAFSRNIGRMYRVSKTCAASALTTPHSRMLSQAAFHASHMHLQGSGEPAQTNEISGPNMRDSFASLGPDMCWLKTYQGYYQVTMDGFSDLFSGTWPSSGMLWNGQCYRHAPWVRHTHGSACSSWPTPMASDGSGGGSAAEAHRALNKIPRPSGTIGQLRLADLWKLRTQAPLSPEFVEVLMGFPPKWTDLEDSETP